jgi:hypothetical protein
MPMHFEDRDVMAEVDGLRSALIVPCNLCPAVTVATRHGRAFMRFLKRPMKSAPVEEYLEAMQSRLGEKGIRSSVFRSRIYHQWFMCMWTEGRRKKLAREAAGYDAVIVLGCDSASETVREAVPDDVKVIEGMEATGIMNGRMSFRLPDKLVFDACKVVPISR